MANEIESIVSKIGSGLVKAESFITKLTADESKAVAILNALTPAFQSVAALIIKDVVEVVADASSAASSKGLNFSLDESAYQAVVKLISDAKSGEKSAVAALAALNVKL